MKSNNNSNIHSTRNNITLITIILLFTIILPSPVIVYGFQIIFLGLFSSVLFISHGYISVRNLFLTLLVIAIILLWSFIQTNYLLYQELLWPQTIRVCFWIFCTFLLYKKINSFNEITLIKSLKLAILILSFSVIIQFILYYFFHYKLDYSVLLGGIESRTSYSNSVYRASGLTAEPSIISGVIVALMTLYFFFIKKFDTVFFIGSISCCLTLSTLGIFLATVFLFIAFLKRQNTLLILLLIIPFVLFVLPELLDRYLIFKSGDDSSNNIKLTIIQNLINNEHLLYLGYGFTGKSISAPTFYEALYDLTFFGSLIILFGLPLGLLLSFTIIAIILNLNFNIKEKTLIFLCLIKISSPTFIFFNLFILLIFIISHKRKI
ncbi:hypothetical protein [Providencia sp. PROV150]|uniref:hypothetical protein n=1 Tax=Providencia sp. PROV150 TaxID=2949860 RepID=UPI00234B80E7|nr:hypothetical protein [Providencia sp. PROV150]